MGKQEKLVKNLIFFTIGNFASKLLSFLLVPFYTAVLTTAEYGVADMITTTVNLVLPIFSLLIYEAVLRFALDNDSDKKSVFSVGVYTVIVGSVLLAAASQILRFFDSYKEYVSLFILCYVSIVFYNLILQFVKGIEKTILYSAAGVINTFLFLGCNIVFVLLLKWGAKGYILSFIVGHAVSAIIAFAAAKLNRYIIPPKSIDSAYYKDMIAYSWPMIPNAISWWISNSSDRYMVTYFCGLSANGIYSVAYKIPSILTIILNIFIGAWQISAVEDFGSEESKKFYSDIYKKYETVLFVGSAGIIGVTKILAKLLFSAEFYNAWSFVPILVLAFVFNSLGAFYGSVYTSAKETKMLMKSTVISAVLNIIVNFILIPKMGPTGAAIATLISYIALWLIRAIDSKRIIRIEVDTLKNIIMFFVIFAECIFICMDMNPYYIVSGISILIVVAICFKDLLGIVKPVFRKIFNKR